MRADGAVSPTRIRKLPQKPPQRAREPGKGGNDGGASAPIPPSIDSRFAQEARRVATNRPDGTGWHSPPPVRGALPHPLASSRYEWKQDSWFVYTNHRPPQRSSCHALRGRGRRPRRHGSRRTGNRTRAGEAPLQPELARPRCAAGEERCGTVGRCEGDFW